MKENKEHRNAFYFIKRWAKSPLIPSYTKGYSAGNADEEGRKEEIKKTIYGNGFSSNIMRYININKTDIIW